MPVTVPITRVGVGESVFLTVCVGVWADVGVNVVVMVIVWVAVGFGSIVEVLVGVKVNIWVGVNVGGNNGSNSVEGITINFNAFVRFSLVAMAVCKSRTC